MKNIEKLKDSKNANECVGMIIDVITVIIGNRTGAPKMITGAV